MRLVGETALWNIMFLGASEFQQPGNKHVTKIEISNLISDSNWEKGEVPQFLTDVYD